MRESQIQDKTVKLLEQNGFCVKLIEYRGSRDCPDAMVFAMDRPAMVVFLELKTKNGRRSHGQINEAIEYAIFGHDVGVPRTADESLAHVRKVFYGDKETETGDDKKANNAANLHDAERTQSPPRQKTPDA